MLMINECNKKNHIDIVFNGWSGGHFARDEVGNGHESLVGGVNGIFGDSHQSFLKFLLPE